MCLHSIILEFGYLLLIAIVQLYRTVLHKALIDYSYSSHFSKQEPSLLHLKNGDRKMLWAYFLQNQLLFNPIESIALAGYGIRIFLGFAEMGIKSRTKCCRLDGALDRLRTTETKERTERTQIGRFYIVAKFRGCPWLQKRFWPES